jgi:hypothetical protein
MTSPIGAPAFGDTFQSIDNAPAPHTGTQRLIDRLKNCLPKIERLIWPSWPRLWCFSEDVPQPECAVVKNTVPSIEDRMDVWVLLHSRASVQFSAHDERSIA